MKLYSQVRFSSIIKDLPFFVYAFKDGINDDAGTASADSFSMTVLTLSFVCLGILHVEANESYAVSDGIITHSDVKLTDGRVSQLQFLKYGRSDSWLQELFITPQSVSLLPRESHFQKRQVILSQDFLRCGIHRRISRV